MADYVRNNRRARTPLRKPVVMAGNLGDDGRNLWRKLEAFVLYEDAAHPAKVYSRKKIFEIEVQYITPPFVG